MRSLLPHNLSTGNRIGKWLWRSLLILFSFLFLVRLFFLVPARVVSGSMMPTLQIGDILLVNKTCYGLLLPFSNKKILATGLPQRGDIVLFVYPQDKHQVYLKRIIGLPGDTVLLKGHFLSVNGRKIVTRPNCIRKKNAVDHKGYHTCEGEEILSGRVHAVVFDGNALTNTETRRFEVPAGKYFVLGDNRDHSFDSRTWGFVPDENLIGRPFVILFSWNSALHRIDWPRMGMNVR